MITLSLIIKTRGIAYLIVEDNELLDWSIKRFRKDKTRYNILDYLMQIIVLGDISTVLINHQNDREHTEATRFDKELRYHLNERSISVQTVHKSILQSAFGKASRYEIAEKLSSQVPQITHFLPKKKRIWESEDANMLLFDAAAQLKAYKLI